MGNSVRLVSLAAVLFLFWLLLSGHYTGFLITVGLLSCVLVVAFAARMGTIDAEGHPIQLLPGALAYWPWLAWEIGKAAWDVTKIILNPALPISPTLVKVTGSQKTDLGVNIYANSITLTPGTVSVELQGHDIVVHALTRDGADGLVEGTMDRRVTRFESG